MKFRRKHRKAVLATNPDGFHVAMERHLAVFYKRSDRLVVSFDNMKSREMPPPIFPWSYGYVAKTGASHLAVMMTRRNDWFRHRDLTELFEKLRDEGFFAGFREVIFYGSSMGGYGALAYAPAAPGSRIVVFAPQTHLDQDIVPFETRFRRGFARGDWSGPFLDGAEGAQTASQVYVLFDPYHAHDAQHVERLNGAAVTQLRLPWSGHKCPRVLKTMDILSDVTRQAFDGTLTEDGFRLQLRSTPRSKLWMRCILEEAMIRGHRDALLRILEHPQSRKRDIHFPKIKAALQVERDLAS